MDFKICVLIALIINSLYKVDASESLLIGFNNVDITNPPSSGVSIPLRDCLQKSRIEFQIRFLFWTGFT